MMTNFYFLNQYDVKVHFFPAANAADMGINLILLPAIGVPIAKYQRFIQQLNSVGLNVITADYPCCGENLPHVDKTVDYNYSQLIHDFIGKLVELSGSKTTVLLGHSLGAHLATLYATQHQIAVIGIATGNIYYKNWHGVGRAKILAVALLFRILSRTYGYFPGYKVGFGYKETKGVMDNWCHTALTGNYDFFAKNLSKAQVNSYFIQIQGDEFAPMASTIGLANYFEQKIVEQIQLAPNFKGNKHSIWLKEPSLVVEKVLHFLVNDQSAH